MLRRVDRYIATTVARPLVSITAVLVFVFGSFDTARTLANFEETTLGVTALAELVGLKTLIALDVLLPLAFYLAVVTGLAGLHQRQETVALRSIGVSSLRTAAGVLVTGAVVAALVASVALFARPWAYRHVHALETTLGNRLAVTDLPSDRFVSRDDRVLYAQRTGSGKAASEGIFIYERGAKRSELILAERAHSDSGQGASRQLRLSNARLYSLDRRGRADRVQAAGEMILQQAPSAKQRERGRKEISTVGLMGSTDPDRQAELQWRLSRPVTALLLGLAAIPLSGAAPRRGAFARIGLAIGLFVVYFVIGDMARSWVEQSRIPTPPGLWWPHVGLAVVLLAGVIVNRWWRR